MEGRLAVETALWLVLKPAVTKVVLKVVLKDAKKVVQ